MHISVKNSRETENTDTVKLQCGDKDILSDADMTFEKILAGRISSPDAENELSLPDIDFEYDVFSMDIKDAVFFINAAHEGCFSVQTAENGGFQSIMQLESSQNIITQKAVNVTNELVNLIEKAHSTQKPVRISFDNDISVVLKIDKQGKVSAEFIPGSLEAESYLMNNVSVLKQRFDEQNLPYTNLSYRQNGRGKNNREKNRGEA